MSTSGGTRAAMAATSRKLKQELVNMLFGKEYRKTGPDGHRLLDYSIYSYRDLRKAYLEKLQVLHPDKQRSIVSQQQLDDTAAKEMKQEFQRLQDVWAQYDEMARSMMKVKEGNGEEANFTMFGVGCSFSDNETERALRNEITDQACRGWFSSGLLGETNNTQKASGDKNSASRGDISLVCDSLFVETTSSDDLSSKTNTNSGGRRGRVWNGSESADAGSKDTTAGRSKRRTLIPGWK
jgi:hypothetical protein